LARREAPADQDRTTPLGEVDSPPARFYSARRRANSKGTGEISMAVYYEDFQIGQEWTTPSRTITEGDVTMFAMLSGDWDEIHTSEDYAKKASAYKTRIAHGMLGMAIIEGLKKRVPAFAETRYIASLEYTWKFTGPLLINDTVHLKIRIAKRRESRSKLDRAIIWEAVQMVNQRGEIIQEGEHALMIWRRPKLGATRAAS
jgi:acyl dehydratase